MIIKLIGEIVSIQLHKYIIIRCFPLGHLFSLTDSCDTDGYVTCVCNSIVVYNYIHFQYNDYF